MSSGYIYGVETLGHLNFCEPNQTKKKVVKRRPKRIIVDLKPTEQNDDVLSGQKTNFCFYNSISPLQMNWFSSNTQGRVNFDCSQLLPFQPVCLKDKDRVFTPMISVISIYEWGKFTTGLSDIIINCPLILGGRETIFFEKIGDFVKNKYHPEIGDIDAFQWIVIELFAIYLAQFSVLTTGEILWVDETDCFYLKNKASFPRKMFCQWRTKKMLKIKFVNPNWLTVIVKE